MKIVKSCLSEFSRGRLKVGIMSAGYHEESEMLQTKNEILTQVITRESVRELAYPARALGPLRTPRLTHYATRGHARPT